MSTSKGLNLITIALLALYAIHIGLYPILNLLGAQLIVIYLLPFFVAFSALNYLSLALTNNSVKQASKFGFVLLVFIAFVFHSSKMAITFSTISNSDPGLQPIINKKAPELNNALSSANTQKSSGVARYLFKEFGLIIPHNTDTGIYTLFEPAEQDAEDRHKRLASMANDIEFASNVSNGSKHHQWVASYLLITFGITITLYFVVYVWRYKKL